MGKKSLIKSTSKKKTAPAPKDEENNDAAPQTPSAKPKSGAKSKTAAEKKEVSRRDLIFKKFEAYPPEKLYSAAAKERGPEEFIAPPYITASSQEENTRIRKLLFNRYGAEDLTAAAEKAAVEKAAAEKAAAAKAAAEKAAAEKAAAKRAEAAKLAAEPKVSVSYDTPREKPKKGLDPVEKATKILAAGIALLILLVVGASFSNSGNYYLKSKDGALEIWKGRFAPMGEELMFSFPGVQMPETVQPVYGKKDVYPLAFNYYIDKADALLQVEGLPDFEGIKSYVDQALAFSVSDKMTESGLARLNNIDRLILIFKADVATSRGTLEDLKAARQYLKDADAISRQAADEALITEKMKAVEEAMAALKAAEDEKAAAPQPKESAE